MNKEQYILEIKEKATDRWGLVKPQTNWIDSGNGVLYTALDIVIRDFYNIEQRQDFEQLVNSCLNKEGILQRTPDNAYGQEQWDNYLGVAVGSIVLKQTEIPKKLYLTALKNGFLMDTDGKKEMKDFLGRFPHVWCLMVAAASPMLKYAVWPILALYHKFFMFPTQKDGSGANLQFMYCYALSKLYGEKYLTKWFERLNKQNYTLGDNFKSYLSEDHPILNWQLNQENN